MSLRNLISITKCCQTVGNLKNISKTHVLIKSQNLSTKSPVWDLMSSVCVERRPTVTKELNQIEKDFLELSSILEYEKSHLSDHEVRHIKDVELARRLKSNPDEGDLDAVSLQTAQDFEDANLEELKSFVPSPKQTKADAEKDFNSTERKLDEYLFLCLRHKLGSSDKWMLPQAVRNEGESMRQTAERIVKDLPESDLSVQIIGNAPIGYYKYKYPKSVQTERTRIGAKIFFFKGRYNTGNVGVNKNDYKWLTLNEMKDILHPDYYKTLGMFLVNDSFVNDITI